MSAKYYTQFKIDGKQSPEGNVFQGVVELSREVDEGSDDDDIKDILARNFDLKVSSIELLMWSRLH